MKIPNKVFGYVLPLVVFGGGLVLYNTLYNVILEAKDIQSFKVEELHGTPPTKLKISGHPFYSGMVVRNIIAKHDGPAITVLVHLALIGLAKPKTSGIFEYELTIPDSVNEVRFGRTVLPIWKRGSPSTPLPVAQIP
jgi:hypothetical protein